MSTARKFREVAKTKFYFGKSAGANNAGERFVQARVFRNYGALRRRASSVQLFGVLMPSIGRVEVWFGRLAGV